MRKVLMSLAVLGMLVGVVEAGPVCFQLSPFDDTLTLDLQSGAEGMGVWPSKVDWNGQGVYHMTGAGMVQTNADGSVLVLNAVLHNPTAYFGGNPVCDLGVALINGTGQGPWSYRCNQSTAGKPDFKQAGVVIGIPCGGESSAQALAVPSVQRQSLAGNKGLQ